MNIKRGLFRLWVVLAAGWVITVGAFSYNDVANPYFAPRAFYFPKDISAANARADADRQQNPSSNWDRWEIKIRDGFKYSMRGTSTDDAYKRLTDALPFASFAAEPVSAEAYSEDFRDLEAGKTNGVTNKISLHDLQDVSLFIAKDTPAAERDRQIDAAFRIGTEVKQAVTNKRRRETIKSAALFGLIPPMLLLLAGMVVMWILRGFRSPA
ncbi:hypothetical protein ACC684_29960 [Rhizobium ruizarguesonis]|uniref:Secreted protein n=1 Tax=Rhizobium ruizarguesonis TaxID=2081791 RepID=A0AB38HUC4_9HYPH|nr:hypothetical protein [Rhizobium ruizarguesonis]TBA13880.1 hypothetical protein ELH61_28180 [Rhizobium ruizarguesonis]TBB58511.1 hypothetical protein ELH42_30290 [Rhizobium ruizarguesonis]TBB60454.1 hypothetical protein ELH45_34565 [Rhizobium ruizarguesonis]TBB83511.1 hypothetical protein ELH39_32120 [Rhizobium ruizarguesonis]TBC04683.1 hypothetical protein ELH40_34960 [Rhizobium ruizarguesonis]